MGVGEQIKRLSKDTLIYGIGGVLQKFIGFFLFPIYTRLLTVEEFGTQDLIFTSIGLIGILFALGAGSGALRYYYEIEDIKEREKIISTWLWSALLISATGSCVFIIFARPFCIVALNDESLTPYFIIVMATLPMNFFSFIAVMVLRLTFQAKVVALLSLVGLCLNTVLSIYLVVCLHMGVWGIFLTGLIGSAIILCLQLRFTYKYFSLTFSIKWFRKILHFGIPQVPGHVASWAINYSNRFFLMQMSTLSAIGVYSVGFRISNLMMFFISAFQTAWDPFAFSLMKDDWLARKTYASVLTYFLLITCVAAVGLSVFAREAIIILATSRYEEAASLVPWLCFGAIAGGCTYIVAIAYGIAEKSYHFSCAVILGGVVTIVSNMILIPLLGILGAAIAAFMGNAAGLVYTYYAGQVCYKVPYELSRIFHLLGLSAATISIAALLDQKNRALDWAPSGLKVVLYASFLGSLLLLRVIRREEIAMARSFVVPKLARVLRFMGGNNVS